MEDDKTLFKCPSIESKALDITVDLEKDLESANSSPPDETHDPNVVDWDGPHDKNNPQNWPLAKKGVNILILSILTFLTPLASSMFAPGVPQLMKEFGTTKLVYARRCAEPSKATSFSWIPLTDTLAMYSRRLSSPYTYWDGHWVLWYGL